MTGLSTISPLDGRYGRETEALLPYVGESALYRARVQVEVEYLIYLSRARKLTWVPSLDAAQQANLRQLYRNWTLASAEEVAAWDRKINHDVKAVEYWIRERLAALGLTEWQELVHWGLTSEDVNNLAYALLIQGARDRVLLPSLQAIYAVLRSFARDEAETPMLARTHGQAATPTTLGKEMNVFAHRLHRAMDGVATVKLTGKLNGATGTYAAQVVAAPQIDWPTFSRGFIRMLELEPVLLTTQIEPHDSIAELCDAIRRVNVILLDLDMDIWRYISDGYFVQQTVADEVGSSTMPHKVNPIDFENSEGNLHLANALLELFAHKLPISRLQRDLSDSTVLRSIGTALGYCVVAYGRTVKGLNKLSVNHDLLAQRVREHPEVLAEAIQTILRRECYPQPYEALKGLTRGRTPTLQDIHAFIRELDISPEVREELLALVPERYIGIAPALARLGP